MLGGAYAFTAYTFAIYAFAVRFNALFLVYCAALGVSVFALQLAKAAGARFGVSPGATDRLLDACAEEGLPLLPGAATASEVMALLERGYTVQKFFPAEAIGGAKALGSLASPLPQVRFCPTGGIGLASAPQYLSLANVMCVGGSWVAPKDRVAAGDWPAIEALAREASRLQR